MSPKADLHCISRMSGGALWPESLAEELVESGIKIAALADHETLAGQERFINAMREREATAISGLEILATWNNAPLHLLCYGFDTHDAQLDTYLKALVLQRRRKTRSLFGRLARFYYKSIARTPPRRPLSLQPGEVIDMVRQAGGLTFLAHPLACASSVQALEEPIEMLKEKGLDGIEAIYGAYPVETCRSLLQFAEVHELLVVAGTNYHGGKRTGAKPPGIDYPQPYWEAFCNALGIKND